MTPSLKEIYWIKCNGEPVVRLLNLIEKLSANLRDAQADIQRLRDENNRLKGEQGKPTINPNVANPPADHSSEKERHKPRQRLKGSKNANIPIDREQVVKVDQANLPADAEFKGL